jgi:hypothetical protein
MRITTNASELLFSGGLARLFPPYFFLDKALGRELGLEVRREP